MSVQVEKLEKNMARLTIEVPAEEFVAALDRAYRKEKNRINVPGFRRGKAPRKMMQKLYGAGIFFNDALDDVVPAAYAKAVSECGENIVSRPSIDVKQVEEGKPVIFTAEVALKPEVTLGQYKGLEVPKMSTGVSEAEVDAEIDKEREQNARETDIDDRPVQNGDNVKLDFEGSVDGVPFEGGKGSDYPLKIGSGSFIPGFEEQLVGAQIGEDVEVHVTFPENYHEESLKGKAAVFKCRVNAISVKELPEADDEFAQEVSEFETLEEYRNDIRAKLTEKKEADAKRQKENYAVEKAVANSQMEIPDVMVDEQLRSMTDNFSRRLQAQGLTVEQYLQFTGMTQSRLEDQMRPEALRRIQNSLVLEAVAKAENIEISDERLEEELAKMAESYKMEPAKLKEAMGDYEMTQMRSDLAIQLAVELIAESAEEVEQAEEAKPDAETADAQADTEAAADQEAMPEV